MKHLQRKLHQDIRTTKPIASGGPRNFSIGCGIFLKILSPKVYKKKSVRIGSVRVM
ncbi:hypothetical protein Hanom_Chr04g00322131 [Helianthus anomalus]